MQERQYLVGKGFIKGQKQNDEVSNDKSGIGAFLSPYSAIEASTQTVEQLTDNFTQIQERSEWS